ncbi:cytochrome P450 [Aspergillus heteromorphus CBS 117.55]|uniref:Cytochrome P450 n=1 Tax=Aspergillus heteromorphus CBS 117.55 TaxID=1448321 RepID=A0A317X1E5_9EURO|nr:cytochrome P450 [Aspergillus heteromorphus CBS 117.55]PWY92145.1 cytochrome P450 [Aspergillus heteromorphus CBS 117.55]
MASSIPKPPGIFLLGNLFDVNASNPWNSFNKLATKYRPICKVTILGHDIVLVTGAALIEEICDETRFRKCVAGPIVEIRQAVHSSLFTAYNNELESWGVAHRIMAPLVSWEAVEQVFADMREVSTDLIKKWTAGPRQRVNVTDDLDRVNHAANMLCFFDQRLHCLEGPEPSLIKAMEGATTEAVRRPSRPKILNWLFYQRKFDTYNQTMRDYSASCIEHRRANPSAKKDMLHAIMEGKDPQTGEGLNEEQMIDEIINCFIGSATAPNLVAFALYYLIKNPHILARAREEIDSVVGPNPSSKIEHHHLAALPYCTAILREAMRLSPPAPGFNIEPIPAATKEEENTPVLLAGGQYQVPRNQPLIAILYGVNRDPAVFDNPEAFNPDRMLGEKYEQLPEGVKKGFGNGKRECIGKRYAWEWSLFTLITIMKDVEVDLADKGYVTDGAGDHYNGAFTVKPLDFFAITGPRPRIG